MTELDQELPETVLELIDEFGKSIRYGTIGAGEYDPETGKAIPVETMRPIKALVGDYSLQGSGQGFASGMIETGDKQVFAAALSFPEEPTTGDKFKLTAEANADPDIEAKVQVYTVMNVKATYSGDLVALYEIQGRG